MADTATQDKTPDGAIPDAEIQRQVEERQRRREAGQEAADRSGDEPRTGKALLAAADSVNNLREGEKPDLTDEEAASALDYFLATANDPGTDIEPKTLKLNLGTSDDKKWVRWTIIPVEDTYITKIRKESQTGSRAQKRRGDAEVDEAAVARLIVVKGTIDPDPRELARTMNLVDPKDAIQNFFAKYGKTGLITQISGEILSISGWDDEDVKEVDAAQG